MGPGARRQVSPRPPRAARCTLAPGALGMYTASGCRPCLSPSILFYQWAAVHAGCHCRLAAAQAGAGCGKGLVDPSRTIARGLGRRRAKPGTRRTMKRHGRASVASLHCPTPASGPAPPRETWARHAGAPAGDVPPSRGGGVARDAVAPRMRSCLRARVSRHGRAVRPAPGKTRKGRHRRRARWAARGLGAVASRCGSVSAAPLSGAAWSGAGTTEAAAACRPTATNHGPRAGCWRWGCGLQAGLELQTTGSGLRAASRLRAGALSLEP